MLEPAGKTVLVVDDDAHIRQVLCFALQKAAFNVIEADNGKQALALFASAAPDVIVLDILMPELDGTEVCREIRRQHATPILFLSSKDDELDRIIGLELGGDDYITKPFSPRELVARVKAVLRRWTEHEQNHSAATAQSQPSLSHGRLRLDLDAYTAHWETQPIVLTVTEFGILRTLVSQPHKVVTRDGLMNGAYDLHRIVSDRTIDSHVRRVRAKVAAAAGKDAAIIETVHGLGYRLGRC